MPRSISLIALLAWCAAASSAGARPNVVVILADDMGYGDLSIQGHPLIRTPNIDQLAREGQRWTSFYASAPLCNPSRVALMTGRMPIRIEGGGKNEFMALPDSEVTLAEMLKPQGYATAYIGKWGLAGWSRAWGDRYDYKGAHPNEQGFDEFFGLIGSNDDLRDENHRERVKRTYESIKNATSEDFPLSLFRQREAIETPAHQPTLTQRYAEESVRWIRAQKDKPFLLFLAHTMPHVPIFASPEFTGHSKAGLYGDVIEELDASVGRVIAALKESGVAEKTLVFFSSDNGPWRTYFDLGGSAGPLRDGKLTAWEGGFRVPGIFWWPGTIKPGVVDDMGVNVDLMKTIASLIGTSLPAERTYDSIDLSATLLKGKPSPRNEWFFYGAPGNLWAARVGRYKLVLESWNSLGKEEQFERGYANHQVHNSPLLFDLSTDMSERLNIADRHSDIVAHIKKEIDEHRRSLVAK